MIDRDQVRARYRRLKPFVSSLESVPKAEQLWRNKDRGVIFSLLKYATLEDAVLGDYTGAELNLRGRLRARTKVVDDFVRAFGKPTREKLTKVLGVPKKVIWEDPRINRSSQ